MTSITNQFRNILDLIHTRKHIAAIRDIRGLFNVSLLEAKEVADLLRDRMIQIHPQVTDDKQAEINSLKAEVQERAQAQDRLVRRLNRAKEIIQNMVESL